MACVYIKYSGNDTAELDQHRDSLVPSRNVFPTATVVVLCGWGACVCRWGMCLVLGLSDLSEVIGGVFSGCNDVFQQTDP